MQKSHWDRLIGSVFISLIFSDFAITSGKVEFESEVNGLPRSTCWRNHHPTGLLSRSSRNPGTATSVEEAAAQGSECIDARVSPGRREAGGGFRSWPSAERDIDSPNSWPRKVSSERRRALLQAPQQSSSRNNNAPCPVSFRRMREFPWFRESCKNFPDNVTTCCKALESAIGQAESDMLKQNGEFRFNGTDTVGACFDDMNAELQAEGVNSRVVPTCFPEKSYPSFTSRPINCQGILNRSDYERLVGPTSIALLDTSCSGDLHNPQRCLPCTMNVRTVVTGLASISPNYIGDECTKYTLFYSAGISNEGGPYSPAVAECLLAIILISVEGSNSKDLALHIGLGAAAAFAASAITAFLFFLLWKRRKGAVHRAFLERNSRLLKTALRPNTGLIEYSYNEIKSGTKNFSAKNYIGSGGFGDVYKGVMDDGLEVAVKRMKNCSADEDADFINEVHVINSVRHRNLVILRGCCVASTPSEGHQRLLVYDYMSNGSLHDHLFRKTGKSVLQWAERRRIAIGMAKGLAYLHDDARPPIIHRDIKAGNILLDDNFEARVADFGLARFDIVGQTRVATAVAGTLGYIAPEYALYGQMSEKSDVYSFGVVLLELMSGRSALDTIEKQLGEGEQPSMSEPGFSLITDWAWAMVNDDKLMEIVDENIRKTGPRDVMERFVLVGILCSHMLVAIRPTMEEALRYLEGDVHLPDIPNRPIPVNQILSFSTTSGDRSLVYDASAAGHRAAMAEFSGMSAGVSTSELLR